MSISVEANHCQEQYGRNGSLPDADKDIFCPDMGGPDYKPNHYTIGCEEMQKARTCKNTKCSRFKGEKPTWREYRKACGDFSDNFVRLVNCLSCGKLRQNHGRGLCKTCHQFHTEAGTLKQFKLKAEKRRKGATEAKT